MTPDSVATWAELPVDSGMAAALAYAEAEVSRSAIRDELARVLALPTEEQRKRERAVLRDMRKRWSERFATACASMLANEVRAHSVIGRRYSVLPDKDGAGQETFTPLGYTKGKRIDVVVTGPLVGLQIGISLKGLNFADDARGNHDKNLTGRLYELRDEVSTVHDYLPRAFMAAFFFMPVWGCVDKTDAAASSFAHLVAELRARTGRLDPSVAAHAWRCDFAAVGLYTAGDPWESKAGLTTASARYFPVTKSGGAENRPPRRGLPMVATTTDLGGVIDQMLARAIADTASATTYSDAEPGSDRKVELIVTGTDEDYDPDEDEEIGEEA
jgi:hypothetical protein